MVQLCCADLPGRLQYEDVCSVLGIPLTEVQGRVQIQYGCKPSPSFVTIRSSKKVVGEARALPGFGESAYGRLFSTRDLACLTSVALIVPSGLISSRKLALVTGMPTGCFVYLT